MQRGARHARQGPGPVRSRLGLLALASGFLLPLNAAATALTTELVATGLARPVYATYAPGDSGRLRTRAELATPRSRERAGAP